MDVTVAQLLDCEITDIQASCNPESYTSEYNGLASDDNISTNNMRRCLAWEHKAPEPMLKQDNTCSEAHCIGAIGDDGVSIDREAAEAEGSRSAIGTGAGVRELSLPSLRSI
jgi:hypothetical protein